MGKHIPELRTRKGRDSTEVEPCLFSLLIPLALCVLLLSFWAPPKQYYKPPFPLPMLPLFRNTIWAAADCPEPSIRDETSSQILHSSDLQGIPTSPGMAISSLKRSIGHFLFAVPAPTPLPAPKVLAGTACLHISPELEDAPIPSLPVCQSEVGDRAASRGPCPPHPPPPWHVSRCPWVSPCVSDDPSDC